MIPRKLELKNFLCYGDTIQVIDFTGYHLICLSGKNGYGKSAMLDAITWALWGQARKTSGTSKPDLGLIRLGQTRMMVSLEFEVNHKIYRVRREFAKTYGKPYAALDFEIFDTLKGTFNSLTDKTIRETQEKIETIIGLDFETFINSAFLKQGQSNEFSKKTPKDRKQILANILGFNKYDKLQQLALDHARAKNDEKKLLSQLQIQYQQELEQRPSIEQQYQEKKQELALINQKITLLNQEKSDLTKQIMLHEDQKKAFAHLSQQHNVLLQEINAKQSDLRTCLASWKQINVQLLKLVSTKSLEQEKQQLLTQAKKHLEDKQEMLSIQEEYLQTRDTYQKELRLLQQNHETEFYSLKMTLEKKELEQSHLTKQLQTLSNQILAVKKLINLLEAEVQTTQAIIIQKQSLLEKTQKIVAQFEKRRSSYQAYIQMGNYLKTQLQSLQHKKSIIEDEQSPSCPLCQQILTAKRKVFLNKQLESEEHFIEHRLARVTRLLTALKQILLDQHKQIDSFQQEQTLTTQLITQQEERHKKITLHNEELLKLTTEHQTLGLQEQTTLTIIAEHKKNLILHQETLIKKLEENTFLQTLHKKISDLEAKKQRVAFDQSAFDSINLRIQALEIQLLQATHQEQEKAKQFDRKSMIKQYCKELKELNLAATALTKDLHETKPDELIEKKLFESNHHLENTITSAMGQKELILQSCGKLEHVLERLKEVQAKLEKHEVIVKSLDLECNDWSQLAQAFSKDGIQALLIEEVIPEIENEANAILTKLTNNQAQIFIESLRDLKSGGVRETLDIKITDALGIRPYEMFSGGEAFRIDFALRIAISKLLARRAGTALQTLIIDEGFGSQDEEGLALLMTALHAIQQDFSKVIIVSHLAEFKDNFPIHFIVTKQTDGSFVTIEERG